MKTRHTLVLMVAAATAFILLVTHSSWAAFSPAVSLSPQAVMGTGFTYQGYLTDGGSPAIGIYDFRISLYDAQSGGTNLGPLTLEDIPVEDGIFTAILDFGAGAFNGDERWLDIGVRPGIETGSFTRLVGRQPIHPAPYALYAVEAGEVAWTDITGRLEGGCPAGSTIQTVNADGSVNCEPHDARPVFKRTALDSLNDVGKHTSITIGVDGLPVLSYYDVTNGDLKVAHCNDLACTSATLTTLDSTGDTGKYISIAIGIDGLPVISYVNSTNGNLNFAHCDNIACTSATLTILTLANTILDTSITIGADGFPIISYYSLTNQNLMATHCNDILCASATHAILDGDDHVGLHNSIAIGADGLPIVSYYDVTNGNLKVAHCNNVTCTSVSVNTLDSTATFVGRDTAITIGADGLPVISYFDVTNMDLKVAHCNDFACTSATLTTLDTPGDVGRNTSITITPAGMPVISYYDNTDLNLKVAHCSDMACTSASLSTLDTAGDVGQFSAITIGMDGMPVISYYDLINKDLKVTHCSNPFCVPYWQRR